MTDETRPVDPDDVLARSEAVHTVELDDETVLLDLASDRLHHLSATATIIWACLDGRSTVREITDDLTSGFDAPPGVVLADSLALLQAMTDDGLAVRLDDDDADR